MLVVRENGNAIPLCPIKITHVKDYSQIFRRLQFLAEDENNYQGFIVGTRNMQVLDCVTAYLEDHSKEWDLLQLATATNNTTTAGYFINLSNTNLLCQAYKNTKCKYMIKDEDSISRFSGKSQ